MNTINELDAVALTTDLPERGLKRGDIGIKVDLGSYGITFLALERRN